MLYEKKALVPGLFEGPPPSFASLLREGLNVDGGATLGSS